MGINIIAGGLQAFLTSYARNKIANVALLNLASSIVRIQTDGILVYD